MRDIVPVTMGQGGEQSSGVDHAAGGQPASFHAATADDPRAPAARARRPADTRSQRAWSAVGFGALLSLVALFAYAPIFAVDFFWQLKLGQLIATQHGIPQLDTFSSVHPERPYVQFQWLWELAVYGVHQLGGLSAVRLFQVLVLTGSYALLALVSRRLLPSRALAFAFCALALVLFEDRFQTRPSALGLGFLALLLPLLADSTERDRPRAWLRVGAIVCLWSNLHSGESLLAVLSFGALSVGSALSLGLGAGSRERARRDALLLLAAVLGALACPAFVRGLSAFSSAIGPQLASGNKEWRPTYTMLENGLSPSYLLIALGPTLIVLLYAVAQWRRTRGRSFAHAPWSEWLLCGGLLVLSQQAVRNAFLCLVPLCFLLMRLPRALPVRSERLVGVLGAALLLVAFHDHVIVGYGGVAEVREVIADDLAPNTFPEELVTFMREAGIEGRSLNDGRWGGYLIWELWPRVSVFVDTRQDLTAAEWPIFLSSQRPDTRPAAMDEAYRRWGLELAVFRGPTFPAIVAPLHWSLLYKAGDQELYQHRDGAHAALNRRRAERWLLQQASALNLTAEPSRRASEVGAVHWLAAPARRRLREHAERLLQSGLEEDVVEGLLLQSQLWFDSGRYRAALAPLERVLRARPRELKALYRYALACHALGEPAPARAALAQLAAQREELSSVQRGRLAALERALAR